MFKRATNVQLIIVLAVLLAAIGVVKIYDRNTIDWNFKNRYTHVDSAKVHYIKALDAPNRNNVVVKSRVTDWKRIKYILPEKASFEAMLTDSGWVIDGQKTDSARTFFFLNSLDTVTGTTFVDGLSKYLLYHPEYELDLYTKAGDSIKVECFVRDYKLFMRSSQSQGNIFDGRADSLFEKVYVGKARFFPKKV